MIIGDFVLENEEKLNRALHGTVTRGGKLTGGVGEDAPEEAIIAEYDRLGGYITKDDLKVMMGSFYDFDKKKPREKPEVTFVAKIDGDLIEVTEDEAQALETAKKKTAKVKAKKIKKE